MVLDLDECLDKLINKRYLKTRLRMLPQCRLSEILSEQVIHQVCESLKQVLATESNVIHVSSPITVVGDVHGQFYDVLEIFKIGGWVPDTNYLFLGTLNAAAVSLKVYGFYNECLRKYGSANVWQDFTNMFDYLTLSCVIDGSIFCIHGGLSPSIHAIDQLRILDRFKGTSYVWLGAVSTPEEIPHDGPICDVMWSDPESEKFDFNMSPRGAGYTYGKDVVDHFLRINDMSHILRAHQLCMEGFQVLFDDKLSTVWSAPNYCYRCGNLASVLEVSGNSRFFNIFGPSPDNTRETGKSSASSPVSNSSSTDSGFGSSKGAGNQYFL